MSHVQGLCIEANRQILNIHDFDEFIKTAHAHADWLLSEAPGDGILRISIAPVEVGFHVMVRLASQTLQVLEIAESMDAYDALGKAIFAAREEVRLWSRWQTKRQMMMPSA